MSCYCWYFKDIGYKFEIYVCNRCHGISMMAYELENIAILKMMAYELEKSSILNVKCVNYRYVIWDI